MTDTPQMPETAQSDRLPYPEDKLLDVREKIINRLKTIYDPEIPVNVYDLGLIYKIEAYAAADGQKIDLDLDMTLTAPGCPIADTIVAMVHEVLIGMEELDNVIVNLVWDPPWDKSRMSDEARLALNMYD